MSKTNSNNQTAPKNKILVVVSLLLIVFILISSIAILNLGNSTTNNFKVFASDLPYDNSVETDTVKEIDLVAAPTEIKLADNSSIRTWTYNGKVPGPEIRVQKGDTLKINFTNNLPQETTIHFHGIRVPNKMDGVPGITQEPIKPGETFTYSFVVPDAGTYWYHPHVRGSEQLERGLYGTIVAEDPAEPKYSQDKIIVIDDWRLNPNGQIDENFNNMHDITHDGRWGNLITVNREVNPTISLKQNERVRLRLLNTSNARVYKLNFGKINVKAIAVDGILAREPFDPNGFELSPGNRIDLDIIAPKESGEFLIKDNFTRDTNALFTIDISEEESESKTFEYPRAIKYPEMNFTEYNIDQEYELDQGGGMMMMGNSGRATINGAAYPDYVKTSLNKNEFQIIRFSNESFRIHPMHLHGQFFKVIAKNGKPFDEPFLRDTVLIHPQEVVDVGLVPIDSGDWALHCHAQEHAEAGMMTIVSVD